MKSVLHITTGITLLDLSLQYFPTFGIFEEVWSVVHSDLVFESLLG